MKTILLILPACAGLLLMTSCAVTGDGGYSSSSYSNFDPYGSTSSGTDQASLDSMMMTQQIQAEANQTTSDAGAAAAAASAVSVPQPMP